jgi:hypothetical protein
MEFNEIPVVVMTEELMLDPYRLIDLLYEK